jgi:hypothetical protein
VGRRDAAIAAARLPGRRRGALRAPYKPIIVSLVGMLRIVSDSYARIKAPRHHAGLRAACTISGEKRPSMEGWACEASKGVQENASPACHSLPAAKARTPAPHSIAQHRPRASALRWFVTCRTCLEAAPALGLAAPSTQGSEDSSPTEICHCASNVTQYGMPSSCHRNDPHQ